MSIYYVPLKVQLKPVQVQIVLFQIVFQLYR